uniref:PGG domain-containing protein n=1 Tax=Triticum urartu TaxID=4572 RepID=A0A8R7UWF1_TRIUA
MPVLFVPSSDGRLAAVAVDGLQNLMPANPEDSVSNETKLQNIRSWLLLLASLVAIVTFTAGLTPSGGFWSTDDDKDKKYLAGDPIMINKSPHRYSAFYTSNTFAFFTSLMIIASLAKNRNREKIMTIPFTFLVVICFLSLG